MSIPNLKTESDNGYKWNITTLVAMGKQDKSFARTPSLGSSNDFQEIFAYFFPFYFKLILLGWFGDLYTRNIH
jgi:hypothetical protein